MGPSRIVALMQSEDRRLLPALRAARPAIARAAQWLRDSYLAGEAAWLVRAAHPDASR